MSLATLFTRRSLRSRHLALLLMAAVGAFCFGCKGSLPDDLLIDSNPTALVFVKTESHSTLNSFSPGNNNLYMLTPISPNGELRPLTQMTAGAVADPEISFDGLKILFSMRNGWNDRWHVYEMNIDGGNLRQLTTGSHDDFDATYLPNGRILFTSNAPNIVDEYNKQMAETMHVMDADGQNIERISFNLSDDFDPIVTRDGRLAWTRWEHHGSQNRFPVFFTKPDGQGTFVLFGPHNRNFFHPRELENGSLIAVASTRVNGDEGPLAILRTDRPETRAADPPRAGDYEIITPDVNMDGPPFPNGAFKYPSPLPDGSLIASYAPPHENEEDADWGLYTIQRDGSDLTLLYNDPNMNEFDAVVVSPRPIPPTLPSTINRSMTSGMFVIEDVYNRQSNDGQARPNKAIKEVKQLMVIRGIARPSNDRGEIGHTEFERKQVIGVVNVQADGSVAMRVPTDTPISFNTMDSLGRAIVVKRNWIYVRPGEQFEKCSGCHGNRGTTTNPTPMAATMPVPDLSLPQNQWADGDFSFSHALEPIIAQKCAISGCHVSPVPAATLDLSLAKNTDSQFSIAYDNMMNRNLVDEPFSRRSRLADKLLGIDEFAGAGTHPGGANALTQQELQKFIIWIDLGGQYR